MSKKGRPESKTKLIAYLLVLLVVACVYYFTRPLPSENMVDPIVTPGSPEADDADNAEGELILYVLDVGQGDSLFLLSPSGKTMLIDASESSEYPVIDEFLQDNGVKRLDIAAATHPHSDHIGAMEKVISNYEIGSFYMPGIEHTTKTFENMLSALEKENVRVMQAVAGPDKTIVWDEAVEIRILSPFEVSYDNLNDYSIMLHVRFGDTSVLLTGDAEEVAEALALKELPNRYFKANVLKLGHHGSSSSTSDKFLANVDPDIAIASLGADNDYGHPHKETLEKLKEAGIPLYRTDLNGIIKIVLDGTNVEVTTEK